MLTLTLRDVGEIPTRNIRVTLFDDGELQFASEDGEHFNFNKENVSKLTTWLNGGVDLDTLPRMGEV
jgi:hypothetical protein